MKSLLCRALILSLLVSNLFPAITEPQTGWSYYQGMFQQFYFFVSPMNIQDVNGDTIEGYGDGTNGQIVESSDCGLTPGCDVIGAFVTHDLTEEMCVEVGGYYVNGACDVCAGWNYYNSYTETNGSIITSITIIGQENSDNFEYYCPTGTIPKLKFYDASEGLIYHLQSDVLLAPFSDLSINLYWPDCTDISDCEEVHFLATEDDPLDNGDSNELPDSFEIVSIYPNPFNPSTHIQYAIGSIEHINISVYDTVGRHVATLYDGFQDIGTHELIWSPEATISSGSYIIMVETPTDLLTSKVTYVK